VLEEGHFSKHGKIHYLIEYSDKMKRQKKRLLLHIPLYSFPLRTFQFNKQSDQSLANDLENPMLVSVHASSLDLAQANLICANSFLSQTTPYNAFYFTQQMICGFILFASSDESILSLSLRAH
jgi:hypothetical protein